MNLYSFFENSKIKHLKRTALVIEEDHYSYGDLSVEIDRIASKLRISSDEQIGLMAHKTMSAYAGLWACLKMGKTYVPLNPKFPIKRNINIIKSAETKTLIVDNKCIPIISELLTLISEGLTLIFPETKRVNLPFKADNHIIYTADELDNTPQKMVQVTSRQLAYLLFTSGSTGEPKGVPICHQSVIDYTEYLTKRYNVQPTDRFSHNPDLTFDLSVHDLYLSFRNGATLYCVPDNIVMAPAKFIIKNELTMWCSVPSAVQIMGRFKMLKPGNFPSIRCSMFCGEPMPKTMAVQWQAAANNTMIDNVYGPTETTVSITHYEVPRNPDEILTKNGVVCIGSVFKTQHLCLVNEFDEVVEDQGEICLAGSQVSPGYWRNESLTQQQFIKLPGDSNLTWYKTGDIARCENGLLFYMSRKDFQVKIRGYRIELDEVNSAIEDILGNLAVHTVPFPVVDGVADNLYTFVEGTSKFTNSEIITKLSKVVPNYMIPKKIVFLPEFPRNLNGKIDRKKLTEII